MGNSVSTSTNVQTWRNTKRLIGGARMQGKRNTMEDFDAHVPAFVSPNWDLLVCVDGHGGDGTATVVSKRLPEVLATHLTEESSVSDIQEALVRTFEEVDTEILAQNAQRGDFSGACCVCAIITPSHFIVAYCGDCVAFVVRIREGGGHVIQALTHDHEPDAPEERARVEAAGSRVFGEGRFARIDGDLNVSRAFGDMQFKNVRRSAVPTFGEDGSILRTIAVDGLSHRTFAVTAHPDVSVVERTVYDAMLLLGSDGLVDLAGGASYKSVVPEHMWKCMHDKGHTDPSHLAVLACDEAYLSGGSDNMTALVWLSPLVPAWHQSSAAGGWDAYMAGRRSLLRGGPEPGDHDKDPFPAESKDDE